MKLLSSVWEVACSRARLQGNGSWGNAVEMNGTLTPYSLSGDAAAILVQMAAIAGINCQRRVWWGPLWEIQRPCASNPPRCCIGIGFRPSYASTCRAQQVHGGFQVYRLTYSGSSLLAVRCIDDKSELAKCSADLMLKMLKCSSRGMHEERIASDSDSGFPQI